MRAMTMVTRSLWVAKPISEEEGGTGLHCSTMTCSVPLLQSESETWLIHKQVVDPHLNPPVQANFLLLTFVRQMPRRTYLVGSDVVREYACKPVIFRSGGRGK